ncbi:MAG: hypothetical protein JSV96_10390 [Candidatus Aminicenantes bacterium]|nr:MAG: hypothetical protein JSV96_10390 [Candidatus Aminicenantes bacterium]
MKETFDLLSDREKKILGLPCLFLGVVLLFLLVISLPQRGSYFRALSSQSAKQGEYEQVNTTVIEKKEEWLRWQEASRDIEDIGKKYFYKEKDGFNQLRLDLEQILSKARMRILGRKRYDYAEYEQERVKKVNISFNLSGSYMALKQIIDTVERFPKFLVIEKIEFLDIDPARGDLELRVILAGYYEI